MTDKRIRWVSVLVWMGIIFAFSAQPHSGETTRQYLGDYNVPVRKAAHMTEYAILLLLSRWSTLGTATDTRIRLWLPLLLSIGYSCTDEFHQNFVPGRSAQVSDVLVDAVGALIGLAIALIIQKLTKVRV